MGKVTPISINYCESNCILVQGNAKTIKKYENNGFYKYKGGNGTYLMNKPADATLNFEANGEKHTASVKNLIKEAYSTKRVSNKKAENFFEDVSNGKIKLDYSNNQLSIIK